MDIFKIQQYMGKAQDAFNSGFVAKSHQKEALQSLSRAYGVVEKELHQRLLDMRTKNKITGNAMDELYYSIPMYLHQFTDKKMETFKDFPETLTLVKEMLELRKAIKEAPVTPPVKDETKVKVEAVTKSIREILEKRKEQYAEGLELSKLFGGLAVTGNAHMVTNSYNTTFVRVFYYMFGKLTPLSIIIGVAQKLEDDKKNNFNKGER